MNLRYAYLLLTGLCLAFAPGRLLAQSNHTVTFSGGSGDFFAAEKYSAAANSTDYYVTFDATYLYIGAFSTSGNFGSGDALNLYLDTDPASTPTTGTGLTAGQAFGGVTPTLPFTANYNAHVQQSAQEMRVFTSNWTTGPLTAPGSFTVFTNTTAREIRIPLATIGNPVAVYMTMWMGYSSGIFSNAPGADLATSTTPTITGYFGGIGLSSADCIPIKTVNYPITASISATSVPAGTYGKVIVVNNTTVSGNITIAPGGSISVPTTKSIDLSGVQVTFGGGTNQAGNGTTLSLTGTGFATTSATSTIIGNGELAITGSMTNQGTMQIGQKLTPSGAGTLTISNGAKLDLRAGGYLNALAPTYGASSTLAYNTGAFFNAGAEWTAGATSGAGVPGNVVVGNSVASSGLSFGTSTLAYTAKGNLTVSNATAGASFALSSNAGGDLNLAGDFTNNGTFHHNGRAVTLNGAALQTITGTLNGSGTTNYFPYLFVTNANAAGISATSSVNAGTSGQNSFTVTTATGLYTQTTGTLTLTPGSSSTITGTLTIPTATTLTNGSAMSVVKTLNIVGSATSSGIITVGAAGTVNLSGSLALTSGLANSGAVSLTTASSLLDIRAGGYVSGTGPTYGAGATLAYNSGGSYGIGAEWTAGATSGNGFPYNVNIGNTVSGTTLTMGSGTVAYSMKNNLAVSTGSGLTLSTGGIGGDLKVAGNLTNDGTFTHNTRAVYLNGTTLQTLAGTLNGSGATNFFPYLFIANTNGVTSAVGVNVGTSAQTSFTSTSGSTYSQSAGTLTLVSGAITTLTGGLTIGSGATLAQNGTTTLNGALTVSGTANINATATVNGATTISGLLNVPVGGNLTNTGAIGVNSGGSITVAGTASSSGAVTLNSGSIANTISGSWTQSAGNYTCGAGSLLTVSGTYTASGSAILNTSTAAVCVFTQTGTYTHNRDAGALPVATWTAGTPGALCNVTGVTGTAPANLTQTGLNHFTWNCAQTAAVGLSGLLTNVGGNLTFTNTGHTVNSTYYLSGNFSGNTTINIGGNLVMNGNGAFFVGNSGNFTTTINVAGNLVQTGGLLADTKLFGGGSGSLVINLQGNFDQSAAGDTVGHLSGGNFTLNFVKSSGTQTYRQAGVLLGPAALYIGNGTTTTNTLQLLTNLAPTAGGLLEVNTGSSLDFGAFIYNGTGTFTVDPGTSLLTANTNGTGAFLATGGGLFGSVQNSSTRTYSTTTSYTFNAASTAQVTGNAVTDASNLTVATTGGLTLTNAMIVSGTASIAGKVTLGINDLTLAGTLTGYGSTAYIKTNSTGQLKQTVGGTAVIFPVGNSAYNPITITNSGTADVYGFRVVDGATPPTPGTVNDATLIVNRFWVVTEAVTGGGDLLVVAQYNTGETGSSFATGAQPYIGLYTSVNATSYKQQQAVLAGSSPFTATSLASYTTDLAPFAGAVYYFGISKDNGLTVPATDYTWIGGNSSDWGLFTNWSPNGVPTTNNNVIIQDGGSPFPCDMGSANRTVGDFTLSGTGYFTAAATRILTIAGSTSYTSSATTTLNATSKVIYSATGVQTILAINHGDLTASAGPRLLKGNIGVAGTFIPGSSTGLSGVSTVNFNGTGAQSVPAINYYNLTVSGARTGTPAITLASGTVGIAGALSLTATGISGYTVTGNTVDYNSTGSQTVAAYTIYNNLTISGLRTTNTVTLASGTIGVGATFLPSATFSTGGYVSTGNTVDFKAAGAQTIPAFSAYNNITNSGNGARTLVGASGTIAIGGSYTPTTGAITVSTSTVNFTSASAQTIPASFYYTVTNTGNGARTWPSTGTVDVNASYTPGTGTHTITGSSFRYSSTANLTITIPVITTNIAGRSYNNLEIVGGTNTIFVQTVNTSVGVAGAFLFSGSNSIFNVGQTGGTTNFIVDGNATFTNTARLRVASGSGIGNVTVTGDVISSSTSGNWLVASLAAGAGTLAITGDLKITNGNSQLNNSTGAGAITVGGNMELNGNSQFIMIAIGSGLGVNSVTVAGSLLVTGSSAIRMESASAAASALFVVQGDATFNSTSATTIGVVNFGTGNLTGNEFRVGGNFSKLNTGYFYTGVATNDPVGFTLNGTGGTKTFSYTGAYAVAPTAGTKFTIASGTSIQMLSGLTLTSGTAPVSSLTVNGTLDLGTQVITAANTTNPVFTLASGATLLTANTGGVAAGFSGFGAANLIFSSGAGYTFNGAAAQVTGSFTTTPTAATVAGLKIDNAAGVTLSGPLTVTNLLNLNAGKLTLAANSLTLGSAGTLTGGGSTAYAAVTGAGSLTRQSLATGVATLFPIGTAASYTPLTISNQAAAADFTARVQAGPSGTVYDATKVVNLEWPITSTSTSANVTFQWNTANQAASFSPANPVEVGRYSAPGYVIVATPLTAAGTNPYTVTANGISGFAALTPFIVGNQSAVGPTTYTWTGATSLSWTTPTNWSPNGVPTGNDNMIISAPGTNTLGIVDTRTVRDFTLNGTGTFTMANLGVLNITGNVTYGGTATATLFTTSVVNISSAASQTVPPLNYGVLNLTGGPRVFPTTGTVGIGGSLTPGTGPFTFTGSTVNFNGGIQSIPVLAYNNLQIDNLVGPTLNGNTVVAGNLTISPSAILDFGATAYTVDVKGSMVNGGTVYGTGTGKIILSGTTAQAMSGTGSYRYLQINNVAGVTSTGKPTMLAGLDLVAGKINTGSDTIILGPSATLTENVTASPQSFVRGLMKTTRLVNTSASTFGGIGYELTAGSTLGTVTVIRQSGTAITGQGACCFTHNSILRQYAVYPEFQPAVADRNVFFKWPSDDDNGQNPALMQLWKSSDGVFPYARVGSLQDVSAGNPRVAFIYHIPSFSVFTSADDMNPLPLGLISFDAKSIKGGAELSWTVNQDKVWARFVVERSADGRQFAPIASQDYSAEARYRHSDYGLAAASRYYRLRLVDQDGKTDYSRIVYIGADGKTARALSLFPNPSSSGAQLALDGQTDLAEDVQAQLYSLDGRLIEAFDGPLSGVNAALVARSQRLAPGAYHLQVRIQDQMQALKLIKQ